LERYLAIAGFENFRPKLSNSISTFTARKKIQRMTLFEGKAGAGEQLASAGNLAHVTLTCDMLPCFLRVILLRNPRPREVW